MAIGKRIRYFRILRGMKLKELGMKIGFPEKSADVRMAQYEAETRTPKAELTAALAHALDVSPQALTVPDIDSDLGLMHTLFALEDICGLRVEEADGEICLGVDASQGARAASLREMLRAWREQAAKLEAGEITREEYDRWRYHYCEFDTNGMWENAAQPGAGRHDSETGQETHEENNERKLKIYKKEDFWVRGSLRYAELRSSVSSRIRA